MRDQADPGGKEGRVVARTVNRLGEFRVEGAADSRDIDSNLLEHLAAHHAADAAATGAATVIGAVPGQESETRGGTGVVLDRLETGAEPVAQRFEPLPHGALFGVGNNHSHQLPVRSLPLNTAS